jgi:hypothetical protein
MPPAAAGSRLAVAERIAMRLARIVLRVAARVALARVAMSGLALAGLAGCLTPSIPIPPPDPELMTFEVLGEGAGTTATFSYPANINYERSIVYVYNHDRGVGIIEASRPDGSVGPTRPVSAAINDQVVVTFQRDDLSVSTCIRLRNGAQSSTAYCSL